jgi:Mg2+/Co2+ transporter CorB
MAKSNARKPNREKRESKQTRAMVAFLLLATAAILAIVTIGGWDKLQGGKPVNVFYIVVFLVFAYYVWQWNRGVLPVTSAMAVVLIIFAAVAAPAWFSRDKEGFDQPLLSGNLLGFLTLVLIPLSLLLIAFAMRGFAQQWNIDEGSRADIESRRLAGELPPEEGGAQPAA